MTTVVYPEHLRMTVAQLEAAIDLGYINLGAVRPEFQAELQNRITSLEARLIDLVAGDRGVWI